MAENISPDPKYLIRLAETLMPYGKYKGRPLIDLPEHYLVWFAGKGFPEGTLGEMLKSVYEIKLNGLEHLFNPLKRRT